MKNIMKKVMVLLFSAMISLSALGGIDTYHDPEIDLNGIVVKENVKKFIEDHDDVSFDMVENLYNLSLMENSSYCFFNGKSIIVCGNNLIKISISKQNLAIIYISMIDEDDQY